MTVAALPGSPYLRDSWIEERRMTHWGLVALALVASVLTACQSTSGGETAGGAGVPGASAGGGLVGNQIGRSLDREARDRAAAAEYRALEYGAPGTPISWRTGAFFGTVTPGAYRAYGNYQRCREFTHTVYVGGQPEIGRALACRMPNGSWQDVG
jgi:surface antigen